MCESRTDPLLKTRGALLVVLIRPRFGASWIHEPQIYSQHLSSGHIRADGHLCGLCLLKCLRLLGDSGTHKAALCPHRNMVFHLQTSAFCFGESPTEKWWHLPHKLGEQVPRVELVFDIKRDHDCQLLRSACPSQSLGKGTYYPFCLPPCS